MAVKVQLRVPALEAAAASLPVVPSAFINLVRGLPVRILRTGVWEGLPGPYAPAQPQLTVTIGAGNGRRRHGRTCLRHRAASGHAIASEIKAVGIRALSALTPEPGERGARRAGRQSLCPAPSSVLENGRTSAFMASSSCMTSPKASASASA